MKKGLSILLLLGGVIYAGLTFADGLTVNFDNAQIVFIDENNLLKKIDDEGTISDVLSINVSVSQILLSPQTNLFIVFSSKQQLSDGYSYLLTCACPTNNTLVGIDTTISSMASSIQVDGSGNLYYMVYPQSGGLTLRKYVNESNITDLINDNISIEQWLVTSDGTLLMGGITTSTSAQWFRKLTPDSNLSTLISGTYPHWLKKFPDDRIYAGLRDIYSYSYYGVYKLPADLSSPEPTLPYIGQGSYCGTGSFSPEYYVNVLTQGHDYAYSQGFSGTAGSVIVQYVTISNRVFVLAGYGGTSPSTLVQLYPTPEIIEPTNMIYTITLIEKCSDKLLIAGTDDEVNKLILYDPSTDGVINLLNEEIEIYHMTESYGGHVWFDGLKFTGNQYIVGRITFTVEYGLGPSGKEAKITPQYTEMATLSGKLNDFVGVVGSTNVTDGGDGGDGSDGGDGTTQYVCGDYDGDGKTDLALYHEASGYWYVLNSSNSSSSSQKFGETGYDPVPGDFDGDGKSDMAVYHESSGYWYILLSGSSYSLSSSKLGESGYTPVPADYDGDGKADLAVYHEASGYWYILNSSTYSLGYSKLGESGYTPVAADYDGDGKTDLAVYHEATGYWYILYSSTYSLGYSKLGESGYTPVPADYDSDSKADLAVYQELTGYWYILKSSTYELSYMKLGATGYTPVPGDYDGDGTTDMTVYHEPTGYWYILLSGSYSLSSQKFGESGYKPIQ